MSNRSNVNYGEIDSVLNTVYLAWDWSDLKIDLQSILALNLRRIRAEEREPIGLQYIC